MTLLERDAELATLAAAAGEAADGRGGVVVVGGPAGIGKSGLLAGLRAEAGDRLEVLAARAGELEREFAYGVVRQLFEAEVAARGGRLSGAAAPAAPVFGAGAEPAASFAVLHGLYWLALDLAAERPLLLAVDDLHWCDAPSLRFLAYLARRLEDVPILLAATLRSAEPGVEPALLAELLGDPRVRVVTPAPLGPGAVAALVRARLGAGAEDAFCAACAEGTRGNPLLLLQLLRTLEAEGVAPVAENAGLVGSVGPRAVASTVLARLARLEPEARAVARALSVLPDGAALPVVAALAGLDESTVAATTGALVRAEIVRPEPPLGFVHPLVRDAVHRELPPGERELQHERAAQLLAEAGAPAEQVAAQLLAAPRRGAVWAVDQLEAAAVAAVARAAPESAVAYGRRALEEPPPPERRFPVLLALAGAEAFTDAPAAAGRLRDAYDAAPDPAARAAIAIPLVHTLLFTDRPAEGVAVAREAAAVAGTDDERMELEALELAGAYFGAEVPDLDGRLAAHRAPPPPGDLGRASLAAIASVHWALTDGRAGACAELALAALRGGDLFASDRGPLSFGATIVLGLADREEAPELLEDALDRSRSRGALFSVGAAYTWLGFAAWRRGDLAGAAAHLEQSRELTAAYGVGEGASMAPLALTVEVALARGDTVLARTLLGQGRDRADRADATRWWRGAEAHVLLAEGRWAAALAMARATGERFPEIGNPVANPWRGDAADALAVLGDATAALELAEAQLALARHWGAPGALGAALRRIGRLTGDADALEEAVAVLDGSPARLELARALAAYGTALRVTERRPADAREPLHRALALAAACDAPALAEHARTELYAAGARPRTDAAGGAAALTASERRVAGMAAEGRSNRDIAQALFVTPKTVEVHLSNAYRKLGIRSRRELPAGLETAA